MSLIKPRVYLSMAYSSNPQANTITAIGIADELKRLGFAVFCPHSHYHWWDAMWPDSWQGWLDQCLAWVPASHVLYSVPSESPGGDREVKEAGFWCVPVVRSKDELLEWRKNWDAKIAAAMKKEAA